MRINQFISHNSTHSRRQADELIKNGFVKINSTKARLQDEVGDSDKVYIKDKQIIKKTKFSVIVYHKAKGELVSKKDDRARKTIYDNLPKSFSSWLSVGRLDYASEGLLLLTDSAVIASHLMQSDLEREYYIKLRGTINDKVIEAMNNGIEIQGKKGAHKNTKIDHMIIAPFLSHKILNVSANYTRLKVLINEGQNRELRRFFGYFDLEVLDLKRVAFGIVELNKLKKGKYRYLTNNEYDKLRDFLKINNIRY